jgi:hypothetical protein
MDLPPEMLSHIVSFIPITECMDVLLINRQFYNIVHHLNPLLKRLNACDIRSAVRIAAKGGHYDIVLFLLEQGADANSALRNAAREGHLDIVKLAIDRGACEFSEAMICAINKNHVHIEEFIGKKVEELYGE